MSLLTWGPVRTIRKTVIEVRRFPRRIRRIRYLALHPAPTSARGRVQRRVLLGHLARAANRRLRTADAPISVDIAKLLLGDAPNVSMANFAWMIDDLRFSSTPVDAWPHTELLQSYERDGDAVFVPERFARSPYARHCQRFIDLVGEFQGATDAAGLIEVGRDFVARAGGASTPPRRHQSGEGNVLVRRIKWSDSYQVVDGHHRVAIAHTRGEKTIDVLVARRASITALQEHLLAMSWTEGILQRYQPVDAPELDTWPIVRRCDDRFAMMQKFLTERGLTGENASTYLDVAACYGWFVRAFAEVGFDAHGNEIDPLSKWLARDLYGIPESNWHVGEVTQYLRDLDQPYTVVSCLSLLHNYILDGGVDSPEGLMRLLDAATAKVLFFDTGEAHEFWFRRTLQKWTPAYTEQWLRDHTTFDEIIALGTDEDALSPFADNFGRTLFALVRT